LKNAAHKTAYFGASTLVETTVEIELAASCIPLVKSNTSAVKIMKMMKIRSGVIEMVLKFCPWRNFQLSGQKRFRIAEYARKMKKEEAYLA